MLPDLTLPELKQLIESKPVYGFAEGGLVEDDYPDFAMMRNRRDPAAEQAQAQPVDINALLSKYLEPRNADYTAELASARARAQSETQAFEAMLRQAMTQQSAAPSKSELYFRLAAAFADPGKTGSFGEGLGKAAGVMAQQQQAQRESEAAARAQRLQLGMAGQQARMAAAREDVAGLRSLAAEDERSRRALLLERLKAEALAKKPASNPGQQAQDEGLTPGTPQFQARVREISELQTQRAEAQIAAAAAAAAAASGNLSLALNRERRQEEEGKKLTPTEIKLKVETEDTIAAADSAMDLLRKAYALNPNTFDASVPDMTQRKMLEAAGSKDPKLINTRTMENLLGEQALTKLRATFGGSPTEGERQILLDLQGIGAKSIEERGNIMRNAFRLLQARREREQRRLNDISSGVYRKSATTIDGE